MLVGIAKFITEKVPYCEVKEHLKNALLEAEDKRLKGTIAHNLAVINYCEIQDHNDRLQREAGGELGQYMRSGQADEEIEKDLADKVRQRREQKEINESVDRQERLKRDKERKLARRQMMQK